LRAPPPNPLPHRHLTGKAGWRLFFTIEQKAAGYSPDRLQVVGPMYREDLVLRAAAAFEAARPFAMARAS